jgi:hypothetical protein
MFLSRKNCNKWMNFERFGLTCNRLTGHIVLYCIGLQVTGFFWPFCTSRELFVEHQSAQTQHILLTVRNHGNMKSYIQQRVRSHGNLMSLIYRQTEVLILQTTTSYENVKSYIQEQQEEVIYSNESCEPWKCKVAPLQTGRNSRN